METASASLGVSTLVIWRSGRMVLFVNISALLSSRPSSSMFSRGAEQIVGGVLVKDPRVGAGIDGPELLRKGVIGGVQLRLLRLDVPVRVVLKLVLDQVVHELPQV